MNSTWNNREDEPCPLGECRHVYDDWPRGSVTRRDREYDQCEFCGWTEAEVEAIKAPPSEVRADFGDEQAARNMEEDCTIGAGAGPGVYTREVAERLRKGKSK